MMRRQVRYIVFSFVLFTPRDEAPTGFPRLDITINGAWLAMVIVVFFVVIFFYAVFCPNFLAVV